MIIRYGTSSFTVRVKEYSTTWESGIEWKSVGSHYRPIDNGADTAYRQSDVTAKASGAIIRGMRSMVRLAAKEGGLVGILCEAYETVFGPEVDYSSEIMCAASDLDDYTTGNLNETVPTEWAFSLVPVSALTLLYSPNQLPAVGMAIQSILRQGGEDPSVLSMETARQALGFGNSLRTALVTYNCSRTIAAKAKAWLQARRSEPFWLENTDCWLFDEEIPESGLESVYVLDVSDEGPLDQESHEHSFSVLYGQAELSSYPALTTVPDILGNIGEQVRMVPVFSDGDDHSEYCSWSSGNGAVASVSTDGTVTFVSNGTATIYCSYRGVSRSATATAPRP